MHDAHRFRKKHSAKIDNIQILIRFLHVIVRGWIDLIHRLLIVLTSKKIAVVIGRRVRQRFLVISHSRIAVLIHRLLLLVVVSLGHSGRVALTAKQWILNVALLAPNGPEAVCSFQKQQQRINIRCWLRDQCCWTDWRWSHRLTTVARLVVHRTA